MVTIRPPYPRDSVHRNERPVVAARRTYPMPSASQHTASAAMQPSQPLPPPPLVPTTHTHFSQSVGSLPFEFRTAAARVPEKLTCVVCGDVLYQPVLLVSCLHSFCGHCAKLRLRAVWECPTCHRAPQLVQPNWPLDNEVAAFLRQYPVRERSPSEKLAIERFYVPGEALLPPARAATVQPSPAAFQPPFVTEAQRTVLVAERAPAPVPAYASALGQRPPKPPAELDGRPVPGNSEQAQRQPKGLTNDGGASRLPQSLSSGETPAVTEEPGRKEQSPSTELVLRSRAQHNQPDLSPSSSAAAAFSREHAPVAPSTDLVHLPLGTPPPRPPPPQPQQGSPQARNAGASASSMSEPSRHTSAEKAAVRPSGAKGAGGNGISTEHLSLQETCGGFKRIRINCSCGSRITAQPQHCRPSCSGHVCDCGRCYFCF